MLTRWTKCGGGTRCLIASCCMSGTSTPGRTWAASPTLRERAKIPLVLAGKVERKRIGDLRARLLGYVPRRDLLALYGAATVVGYPSFYEGFGLPPLEAMACGAAVVATRVASLPELLGDAAVFVEVGDTDGLAGAIRDLADDDSLRAELAAAGPARTAGLSWARTAGETAAVYRSLGVGV